MWNVRNVLRQLGGRLKTSVNGTTQSGREGRTELEDEYKLWTSNLWTSDIFPGKSIHKISENAGLLFASTKKSYKNDGDHSSDSERQSEWHASDIQSSRTWLEAIGWGAALGLGLNILQLRQDEHFRQRYLQFDGCRFSPRWFTNVALSMPFTSGQPGLIRSVLPITSGHSFRSGTDESDGRDSLSSVYSDSNESYLSDATSCGDLSEYQKPSYSSETAVMMAVLRQELTNVATDYMGALHKLLAPRPTEDVDVGRFQRAQEEYNLGLFRELGIGIQRDSDAAFKHYVESAILDHPGAIKNIVSFHKYASVFPDSDAPDTPSPSLHRCSSSPALSTANSDSGRDSVSSLDLETGSAAGPTKTSKFWSSSDEDSRSSSDISRSSSFPVLPRFVACV